MAQLVVVPVTALEEDLLRALLEDYASRDGTDYGERELSLNEKVSNLRVQLSAGSLSIIYDLASEEWDLVPEDKLALLEL